MTDIHRYRVLGLERGYSRPTRRKAYLMIFRTDESRPDFLEESFYEMTGLAVSAGMRVVGVTRSRVERPSPSHFLREGKLAEITQAVKQTGAEILIGNVELSPTQSGNLEMAVKVPVWDRTALILEIFGRRARSKEGKLQVELAQLMYALPRLGGLGKVMSRLGGGLRTRGPGESELENDRRKVRRRIREVKDQLEKVSRHRERIRAGRKRKRFVAVALVGYTNAGKSELLNALTGARATVEDKMFATLDPLTRRKEISGGRELLFIDTVGFLKDLPHALIESFHATLEEAVEADVLVHVLDVSDSRSQAHQRVCESVLKEIGAGVKPMILALNKADLLAEEEKTRCRASWPQGILISAKERQGLDDLMRLLEHTLNMRK